MNRFERHLSESRILVSDGAWGTEMARLGLDAGEAPERWNLDHPEKVRFVADKYVEAGADIILTNTFGASRFKLAKLGLDDKVTRINRIGAELSRQAAHQRAFVIGSVGPTGEFMEPYGTITESEMVDCFAEQAKALVEGGVDGLVVETMMDLREAKAALKAAKENADCPIAVCLTYESGPGGIATMMGVTPERAAAELEIAGADLIGANCGAGMEFMVRVAEELKASTSKPLWIKPNAGLPELVGGQTVYKETPEQMARYLPSLVEFGTKVVGGCCGTTPSHVRAMAETAARLRQGSSALGQE